MTSFAPLVIAVDGPAASGKGTIAKALASHYGLPFMDTGKLYRACGLAVRLAGHDPYDAQAAEQAARQLNPALLDDAGLMSALNSDYASIVSSHPGVRAALFDVQRAFARQPGGAVLERADEPRMHPRPFTVDLLGTPFTISATASSAFNPRCIA